MRREGNPEPQGRSLFAGVLSVAVAASCLMSLAVSGCARQQQVTWSADSREFATVLLAPAPFRTICLEVDSVVGAEAPEGAIDALAAFLRDSCQKPVSVVARNPMPAEEAAKVPPRFLALQRMNGPPAADPNGPSAYVYVLLYRGPGDVDLPGHVRLDYPCAMFVDTATPVVRSARSQIRFILKHEAAHMLTLCTSTTHGDGDGAHCRNNCVVGSFSISREFLGLQRDDLCEECRRDLAESRRSAQPAGLVFKGPFVVRQERGYFVARLPAAVHLQVGEADGFDWADTLGMLRAQMREMPQKHPDTYALLVSGPNMILKSSKHGVRTKEEYLRRQRDIAAACDDPDATVRQMARALKARLDQEFGLAAGASENQQPSSHPSTAP